MNTKSVEILRFLHNQGPSRAEDVWTHFGMGTYRDSKDYINDLCNKHYIRIQQKDHPHNDVLSILPAGLDQLELLEKQTAQEKENARLVSEIVEMRKNLEELKELRDITESLKTQTNLALEKANRADWISILSLIIAAGTFVLYLFEVFCT